VRGASAALAPATGAASLEDAVQFMLLIMEPRGQRAGRSEAEGRAVYERMLQHSTQLAQRGVLR
jgi:hypothetical protein